MLRVEAGLGLRALAAQIGVSSAYLSRVENGHDPPPTADRLEAIASELDVPPSYLIDLAGRTGAALSDYVDRVPAASSLFLEIARRQLDSAQIARVEQFLAEQFSVRPTPLAPSLAELIPPSAMRLKVKCRTLGCAIDIGAAMCGRGSPAASREALAASLQTRERDTSTALGNGIAVPHAIIDGATPRAALVTPARPLHEPTPDDRPIGVVIVLVSGSREHHLETLAQVARLASHGAVDELRRAATPRRAAAILQRF